MVFGLARCVMVGAVCLLLVTSFPASSVKGERADDNVKKDKADDNSKKDKQVVTSKATKGTPAKSVNFRKELKLPYPSLGTLGSRIHAARRDGDPVALANAANELHVAEKVSGKKASVTSEQLIKESAELAALRKQVAELRAVREVSNQIWQNEDHLALLKREIALAQKRSQEDVDAFKQNQEPTSAPRQVIVNNYTTQYLSIHVNGYPQGIVEPGRSGVVTINHRWNPTVLKAYGNEDQESWGPRYVWGEFKKYTWNIND
jgi:hypothetical protein